MEPTAEVKCSFGGRNPEISPRDRHSPAENIARLAFRILVASVLPFVVLPFEMFLTEHFFALPIPVVIQILQLVLPLLVGAAIFLLGTRGRMRIIGILIYLPIIGYWLFMYSFAVIAALRGDGL